MNKFFTKKISILTFVFVPIIFLWHPNWLGFLGVQPYWPLFWLLPWSFINGPINGLIFGLFLGLILDSLTLDSNFSQIPGLILCGFLFGRIKPAAFRSVGCRMDQTTIVCSGVRFIVLWSIVLDKACKSLSVRTLYWCRTPQKDKRW